jgi:uncharacterized protein (DUF983 family)
MHLVHLNTRNIYKDSVCVINMKDEVELKVKPLCPKCNSGQVYLRIRTMEKVCRMCGYIEKLKLEIKK